MHKDDPFIRANLTSLLLVNEVKTKTDKIPGDWRLNEDEIEHIHPMPNNIEFSVALVNGASCLYVSAKINRKTARFSNIEVREF